LLTVAAPSTAPTPTTYTPPAGTTPMPVPPAATPTPYTGVGTAPVAPVLVEEAQNLDLDTQAAASLLKTLQDRLENDHELELSLSWRLQRRSSKP